jgi:solute:Na+ symporter, SSS family
LPCTYDKIGGEGVLGSSLPYMPFFRVALPVCSYLAYLAHVPTSKAWPSALPPVLCSPHGPCLPAASFDFGNGKKLLLDLGPLNYTHHKYMIGVYSHVVLVVVGMFPVCFSKRGFTTRN